MPVCWAGLAQLWVCVKKSPDGLALLLLQQAKATEQTVCSARGAERSGERGDLSLSAGQVKYIGFMTSLE